MQPIGKRWRVGRITDLPPGVDPNHDATERVGDLEPSQSVLPLVNRESFVTIEPFDSRIAVNCTGDVTRPKRARAAPASSVRMPL